MLHPHTSQGGPLRPPPLGMVIPMWVWGWVPPPPPRCGCGCVCAGDRKWEATFRLRRRERIEGQCVQISTFAHRNIWPTPQRRSIRLHWWSALGAERHCTARLFARSRIGKRTSKPEAYVRWIWSLHYPCPCCIGNAILRSLLVILILIASFSLSFSLLVILSVHSHCLSWLGHWFSPCIIVCPHFCIMK